MAIGDFISATDYNSIRTKIINVMSTGSGNFGYGQTTFSSLVSAGNTVTKTQWDSLRYDIYNAILHQTGSAASLVQVAVGDVIRFGASNPNSQYDTVANDLSSFSTRAASAASLPAGSIIWPQINSKINLGGVAPLIWVKPFATKSAALIRFAIPINFACVLMRSI